MHIYIARPIDSTGSHDTRVRRITDYIKTEMIEARHTVFDAATAWSTRQIDGPTIQTVNQQALLACDGVIAILPKEVHTLGVPLEIQVALNNAMPVAIWTDRKISESAVLSWLEVQPGVQFCSNSRHVTQVVAGWRRRPVTSTQIARWAGEGRAPKDGKPGDAGFDLYYHDDQPLTIAPGDFMNVRSKIAVQLPEGMWGLIVGRSSTFARRLFVAPSVIDAGYRGELYACCWNIGVEAQTIEPGDRVAQIVPFPLTAAGLIWSQMALDDSVRGETGFGSTGR
jgi:dUTP pyrophosphatase